MTQGWGPVAQCEVVDFNGNRCALPSGHVGNHAAAGASVSPPPQASTPAWPATTPVEPAPLWAPGAAPKEKKRSSAPAVIGVLAILGGLWWFGQSGTTPTSTPAAPRASVTRPTAGPAYTTAQQNAIRAAQAYLDYTAFSRKGLIEQLEYEGYATADATLAVDALVVDWKQQAALMAKKYLDYTSFSRQGLIEQLEYEGFSRDQAVYGADQVGL
jgi:hypothetical protein